MKQISLATLAETGKQRKTKRERFLDEMEAVMPQCMRAFARLDLFDESMPDEATILKFRRRQG